VGVASSINVHRSQIHCCCKTKSRITDSAMTCLWPRRLECRCVTMQLQYSM